MDKRTSPSGGNAAIYRDLLALTALLAATILIFWPATRFSLLAWDDQYHLTNNPFIQTDSPDRFAHFWEHPYGKLYIPIAYNVWALVYQNCFDAVGNFSPWLLHTTNVVLHAVCGGLVYSLLRLVPIGNRKSILAALGGAAVFVFHPLQVESIAWISEFRGLLGSACALGAMIAYVLAVQSDRSKARISWQLCGIVLFAAGLLCKPSVVAVPLILVAIDRIILRRTWKQIRWSLLPWLALGVTAIVVTACVQPSDSAHRLPLWLRPFVAGDALGFYLAKLAWPFSLCADYSRTPEIASQSPWFWIGAVSTAIFVVLVAWHIRSEMLAAFCVFAAALAPVLGFVQFDFQRISTVADRYAYLAMLGPAILLTWIATRWRSVWLPTGVGILLVLFGWRSVDQLASWQDDHSLWSHALAVNPRAVVAMDNLAQQAADRGDTTVATELFNQAISIAPHRGNGFIGLAKIAREAGDTQTAARRYRDAINSDPTDGVAFNDLGSLLAQQGKLGEAEKSILAAIAVDPTYSDAWTNLGSVLLITGRTKEAADALITALALDPRNEKACLLSGRAAIQSQKFAAAEGFLRRALALEPTDIVAINDLGQTLAAEGKVDEAVKVFEQAVRLHPESQVLRENLQSARDLKRQTDGR
jgi:Tfp pilus assembly protein PilF